MTLLTPERISTIVGLSVEDLESLPGQSYAMIVRLCEACQHALEDLEKLNVGHASIEDVCGIIPELRTAISAQPAQIDEGPSGPVNLNPNAGIRQPFPNGRY